MRHPEQLPKIGLVELLVKIREALYFDDADDEWDRDHVFVRGKYAEAVADIDRLFAAADLVPLHSYTQRCVCPRCEVIRADRRTTPEERLPAP